MAVSNNAQLLLLDKAAVDSLLQPDDVTFRGAFNALAKFDQKLRRAGVVISGGNVDIGRFCGLLS